MAQYIGRELIEKTQAKFGNQLTGLVISVDENRGQWGVCEMDWPEKQGE